VSRPSRAALFACALLLAVATTARAETIAALHCNDDQGQPLAKGKTVTVTGIVTGQFSTEKNARLYIQDATGGINVYGAAKDCVAVGDSVRVTGSVAGFNGLTEITGTKDAPPKIERLGKAVVQPEPVVLTLAQVLASLDSSGCEPNESRLVRIDHVVLRSSRGDALADTSTFRGDANWRLVPADGDKPWVSMRTLAAPGCADAPSFDGVRVPVGPVSVTGILSQYTGRDQTKGGYQILPRSRDDIRALPPAKQ